MLEFYLFCLIIGGGLITFSLIGGGHGDADTDTESHPNMDMDHQIELDHSTDVSHQIEIDNSTEISHSPSSNISHIAPDDTKLSHSSSSEIVKFFSIRNLTYFAAFFGLTGTILTLLSSSAVWTLVAALIAGTFSACYGYKLMKYLKKSESGQSINIYNLIGQKGIVTLPLYKGTKGKIQVFVQGQTFEIPAVLSENADYDTLKVKDEVLIIEINNSSEIKNIAVVTKYDL